MVYSDSIRIGVRIQALDYVGLGWIVDAILWAIGFDATREQSTGPGKNQEVGGFLSYAKRTIPTCAAPSEGSAWLLCFHHAPWLISVDCA